MNKLDDAVRSEIQRLEGADDKETIKEVLRIVGTDYKPKKPDVGEENLWRDDPDFD
ncbi:MAG: hypothetical protein LBE75_05175 [Burkholderiales bacterium]|jgi:hypothetical protein|nr:hypothetical protein [Burkholderiales bacterium]